MRKDEKRWKMLARDLEAPRRRRKKVGGMSDRPILINSKRERIDVDELIDKCRSDPNRILADDEVGLVAYVGDLDIYTVSGLGHPQTGDPSPAVNVHWVPKANEVSLFRFAGRLRRQVR